MSSKPDQQLVFTTAPGVITDQFTPILTPSAVKIPAHVATVELSGHLGWAADGTFPVDLGHEVENVFKNIEASLIHAGVADGWKAVYSIQTFQSKARVPNEDDFFTAFLPVKQRYMGSSNTIWTGVSVPELHGGAAVEIYAKAVVKPDMDSPKL